ncbi:uncharacterized protein DS421_13g413240 [Arachis hypogaea]|nr:uncharacterized protein DS421_13g413240 [Arachis hypogaea]
MQPPSLRHSSTCPATTAVASAPPRYALVKRHPNASVSMHFRASTQPPFSRCVAAFPFSHIHRPESFSSVSLLLLIFRTCEN